MRKLLVLAISAPFLLVGAADPNLIKKAEGAGATEAASVALQYRPCRPGPGDDRCIQLYERGVRAAYASWQRRATEPSRRLARNEAEPRRIAMGGPDEPRAHHRRQHHASHDPRCVDRPRHDSDPEMM